MGGEAAPKSGPARVYWSPPPLWRGQTAFVLGGGPSLRGFDASILRGHRALALKESALLAPWAPFMIFCDENWFTRERELVDGFAGEVITVADNAHGSRCLNMKRGDLWGLSDQPDTLNGASTVAHFGLDLLAKFAVARIVLLGMELGSPEGLPPRWHDRNAVPHKPENLVKMRIALETCVAPLAARRIEVINCTPNSRLDLWPYRPLADVLAEEPNPVRLAGAA